MRGGMQRSSPLPVLLCFDVEPDDRHVEGRPESWPGAEATPGMLERWRRRLSRATARPARFSWFLRLDPQIAELYGTALWPVVRYGSVLRSEEHTSELQSQSNLVCRLLLEKKK